MMLAACLLLLAQNDKAQANGRDDAWESAWVAHCRSVYSTAGKNAGMTIHVGDSITHANPYGQWPRYGAGKTAEDAALTAWILAGQAFPGSPDAANANGFYLCAVDVAGRSMTASGGVTTAEYLSGSGNGGAAMPSTANTATARGYVVDGAAYSNNLHVVTVASAFANAQFAVVMLGTNDIGAGRQVGAFIADLGAIVDALEARSVVVVLSTIPPRTGSDVSGYNAAIVNLAQTRGLPLIDYHAEILARRSGASWQGTLISGDGVHPTGAAAAADPYASGGDPAAHRTGANCTNDGYLLRSWLTVQKLKEVKYWLVDNPTAVVSGGGGGGGGASSSGGSDDGGGCGSRIQGNGLAALGLALAALALGLIRRR